VTNLGEISTQQRVSEPTFWYRSGVMSGPIDLARLRDALKAPPSQELERPRRAAVALVLSAPVAEPSVLLVRRTERVGDPWSGHMALPGGHAEPGDLDLLHTARRETLEEVGLDLSEAELLGTLDDIMPMRSSQVSVRPFVFWVERVREPVLSGEVAEALWVPLARLASGALRGVRQVQVGESLLEVPAYVIDERVVWGMTFRLLELFLQRARGGP
jgi:8-oxo-dGTP pyrophosphatase MutT (NUDIX family)